MSLAASLAEVFAARPDPEAVPAVSIAVAVDRQVVIEAWGVRASTVFQAASISKPVAAMVAFADLAAELVLRPAGMTMAGYAQPNPADAAAPHVAGRQEAWRIHPELAAAGLRCTAADLLHLAQAIQAAVAGEAGAILPAKLAEAMLTPQLADWGLGLRVTGHGDVRTFSHGGENYGYECAMLGSVGGHNAVAVMTSSDQGVPVLEAMAAAITANSSWQIT